MKTLMSTRAGARRGSVLVLSLMVVMVIAVLGAGYIQIQRAVTREQMQAIDTKEAFYVAEAGIAEAFAGLKLGLTGAVGSPSEPAVFGDGLFWVEIDAHDNGRVALEATALVGTGRATLAVLAERHTIDPAWLGAFSDGDMTVGKNVMIDGYDSALGTYASQIEPESEPAHVEAEGQRLGSNETIYIEGEKRNETWIFGDVVHGPDGDVEEEGKVKIEGDEDEAEERVDLPPVLLPVLEAAGGVHYSRAEPLVLPPGAVAYEYLHVASGSDVSLVGPAMIVLGGLELDEGAALHFDTEDGEIELFVADYLHLAAGSSVTTSGEDTSRISIRMAGRQERDAEPEVRLGADSAFHGTLYAPEANVVISEGFELFGFVTAGGLELKSGVTLHIDRALLVSDENGVPLPEYDSWRIVNLTQMAANVTKDPFQQLGLDRELLPPPAGAHDMSNIHLHIEYKVGLGENEWTGWEDEFDWTPVTEVIEIRRHEKKR